VNVRLLNKVNDMLAKDLDICLLIQRIKDVEKLKSLFLSDTQQTLFNFFPKPIISLENEISLPSPENLANEEAQRRKKQLLTQGFFKNKGNVSFRNIAVIIKAVTRFKRIIRKNKISYFK